MFHYALEEMMNHWKIGKLLISLLALSTIISPYLIDFTDTHLFNPNWPPHAKYHDAQTILLASFLGAFSLWFLWRKKGDQVFQLAMGTLLASLFPLCSIGAIWFPGTAFADPESVNRLYTLVGITFNQGVISFIGLGFLCTGYFLEKRRLLRSLTSQ
jgi:hypothetical protein